MWTTVHTADLKLLAQLGKKKPAAPPKPPKPPATARTPTSTGRQVRRAPSKGAR